MADNSSTLQIINQETRNMLKRRLERDELTKRIFNLRLILYKINMAIEKEHIQMSDLKISMHKHMIQLCELYKKNRRNNIIIELEHNKITEMKSHIITELIALDNQNIYNNFDFARELKISELTNSINYDYPSNWEENKTRLSAERERIESQIKEAEKFVSSFEVEGSKHMRNIAQFIEKRNKIDNEIIDLTDKVLPLNDNISDDTEIHDVTLVNINQVDFENPENNGEY